MARDPQQMRKAYEFMLGKDLVAQLSDDNIKKLSAYYNSLPLDQQSKIDSEIVMGKGDFLDMAREFGKVNKKQKATPKKKKVTTPQQKTQKEGLPNLDELINSVQNESTESNNQRKKKIKDAVAKATKKQEEKQKQQTNYQKDPRIVELLGIGGIEDLTEDEYKSLLKEKMLAGRMSGTKMSSTDTEAFTEEFKRVKAKKPVTKASSTPKKVNPQKLLNASKVTNKKKVATPKLRKTQAAVKEDKEEKQEKEGNIFKKISIGLGNIASALGGVGALLQSLLKTDKQQFAAEKRTARAMKKRAKEDAAESATTGAKGLLKKIKAPKLGFFERIKQYFGNILAGAAVMWIINWISDPENQKTIDSVLGFIEDHMGLILGGLLALIGIDIGLKLLGFIKMLVVAVKGLSALLLGPAGLIGLTLAGLIAIDKAGGTLDKPAGGNDQITGEQAVWNSTTSNAKTRKREIESVFKHLPYEMWDPDALDYYKQLHEELELPMPEGLADAQSNQLPSMLGTDRNYGSGANMSRGDMSDTANQKRHYKNILEMMTSGTNNATATGKEFRLEGVGTYVQGRHRLGWAEDKFFTPDGEKINYDKFRALIIKQVNALGGWEGTAPPEQIDKNASKWGSEGQPSTGQTPMIPQTTPPPVQQSGTPQVIIPLDHARTPGAVPDTTGGSTYSTSAYTGADGRERQHQDPAARRLQAELAARGVNARIVRPEDFASYEEYDAYLKEMDAKGVRSIPLHFDAIRGAGGVGFLTRTRAGDTGDAALAAPINEALRDFQRNNPELGNYRTDTDGNKTVNLGRNSPTALVELGVMTDWEDHYGANFTNSDKFQELIRGVADGIVEGGNFKLRPAAEQNRPDAPAPPNQEVSFMPLPGWNGSGGTQLASSATGAQKTPPSFSPIDPNNLSTFATKSIYNTTTV